MKNLIGTGLLVLTAVAGYCQDLVITNVSGSKTFDRYMPFTVSATLTNQGIVDIAKATYIYAYLSTDAVIDGADVQMGSFYVTSIKAGQSLVPAFSAYYDVVSPPGTYYLILKADAQDAQVETDESNNISVVSGYVVNTPNIDFTFQSFSLNKSSAAIDDVVVPVYTVKNGGTTPFAGSIYTSFYLSTDNVYDASDVKLNDYYNKFSSGQATSQTWYQLMMPHKPTGQYYIIGITDRNYNDQSEVAETNEGNNTVSAPLTLVNNNIDLDLTSGNAPSASYIEAGMSQIHVDFNLKNKGTTGVLGYSINAYLSPDPVLDIGDYLINVPWPLTHDSYYVPAGGQIFNSLSVDLNNLVDPRVWGTNYVIIKVNADGAVAETNTGNNTATSMGTITINPPVANVGISNANFSGAYNNLDNQLEVDGALINRGSFYSGGVTSTVSIRNASNVQVYSTMKYEYVYLYPGMTSAFHWELPLSSALAPGQYTLTIQSANDPNPYSIPLTIQEAKFNFYGTVKGEDGVFLTKGNVFLYRKENNTIKFVDQKQLATPDSTFSFQVDTRQYTLYFIPDKTAFPGYVPTILGKTVMLNDQSFLSLTEDKGVRLEILKVNPLPSGSKIISGTVSQTENPVGRGSVEGLSVILLSTSGDVVGLTQTDDTGFYQFTNLPEGQYQVLISFPLDEPQMEEPITADVTLRNAQVDISVSPEGTQGHVTEILLKQHITFGKMSGKRYADGPFALEASTDASLPLSYTSSRPDVAKIEAGKVVIVGVGTTTITALQPGDDIYQPATPVEQTLVIAKALQQISFSEIGLVESAEDISLDAAASSTLPVSYVSEHPEVATVEGQVLKIHGSGETLISALQPGNDNYEPAENVSRKLTVQLITGIEDPLANVTVHPNPTADFLIFSSSSPIQQVAITDVTGRSQALKVADHVADLRRFEAGVYVVKVQYSNGVKVFKVMKE
ncbi:CARDB domain-containing protein [Chryseolinea soli]|uniref:T9SS C-terminal target domain-containing protein n=1 Tax=Chryseolinea soli TaxID=2321403 RepID=A0A385SL42_9BACT|nr:CARDB domain-containing protein [Chryseolinea soli]AYB32483.1 T9SS C-terminal target domain-containing protein [Chryseolinea soli]